MNSVISLEASEAGISPMPRVHDTFFCADGNQAATHHGSYFPLRNLPAAPTEAPKAFIAHFQLQDPPLRRRVSIEDTVDEDEISFLEQRTRAAQEERSSPEFAILLAPGDEDVPTDPDAHTPSSSSHIPPANPSPTYPALSVEKSPSDQSEHIPEPQLSVSQCLQEYLKSDGKLREAPSVADAVKALKDVQLKLRGES